MSGRRTLSLMASLLFAATACASGGGACLELPLDEVARATLERESALAGFAPVLPCGPGQGFAVAAVVGDSLPDTMPVRRVSFVVERQSERAYVLSATRKAVTSSQIPQGTRRYRVAAGSMRAEGFVGASGDGGRMAYLRWRTQGVTYEIDAILGRTLDEAEVSRIATALMLRTATSGP